MESRSTRYRLLSLYLIMSIFRKLFLKVNFDKVNCGTAFAVIVYFLKESVHGFINMRNGRVETAFQIVKFRRL